MKVCILSNDAPAAFQSSINAFIADKKVIDIKYQSMMLPLKFTKRTDDGCSLQMRTSGACLALA